MVKKDSILDNPRKEETYDRLLQGLRIRKVLP